MTGHIDAGLYGISEVLTWPDGVTSTTTLYKFDPTSYFFKENYPSPISSPSYTQGDIVFQADFTTIRYDKYGDNIHIITQDISGIWHFLSDDEGINWTNPTDRIIDFPSDVIAKGLGAWPSVNIDNNGNLFLAYAPFSNTNQNTKLYYKIYYASTKSWSDAIVLRSFNIPIDAGGDILNNVGRCSSVYYDTNNLAFISYIANPFEKNEITFNNKTYPTISYSFISDTYSLFLFEYNRNKTGYDGWLHKKNMPGKNRNFALIPYNEKLYVFGGHNEKDKSQSNTWLYDPSCNEWQIATKQPMDISKSLLDGAVINLDVINTNQNFPTKSIYLFGGYDGNLTYREGMRIIGDPSLNLCLGETPVLGVYRGQEAATSNISQVSGDYQINRDPYLPPYTVLRYIIRYN